MTEGAPDGGLASFVFARLVRVEPNAFALGPDDGMDLLRELRRLDPDKPHVSVNALTELISAARFLREKLASPLASNAVLDVVIRFVAEINADGARNPAAEKLRRAAQKLKAPTETGSAGLKPPSGGAASLRRLKR